jgi:hypothetical protein
VFADSQALFEQDADVVMVPSPHVHTTAHAELSAPQGLPPGSACGQLVAALCVVAVGEQNSPAVH